MKYDWFVMFCMIFLHIFDDFTLQGILANMKQKSWWTNHPEYKPMYRNDWIPALVAHCFSWTFMIMLPLAINYHDNLPWNYYLVFVINMAVHGITDHNKANRRTINLVEDQAIHLAQIVITYAYLTAVWYG